jgi:hypothetical protein
MNDAALQQWADKATVIRCSALSGWGDCPRRGASKLFWAEIRAAGFMLRYIPRGIGAIVGTAVHRGVASVLGVKARTGTLPARADALESSREMLDYQVEEGDIQFDGPHGVTHNIGEAVDQVARMTGVYHDTVAPTVDPIQVEERLEAEVEPGLVLSGQPDLVCREPGAIRDLKTGQRAPVSFAPQLGGYSLLARTHKIDIQRAAIDYMPRVRKGKPQPAPQSTETIIAHAESAAANIIRHIQADLNTFRHGDEARHIKPGDPWAFLANPASMLCSPKYCPAHSTEFCHEGKKQKED